MENTIQEQQVTNLATPKVTDPKILSFPQAKVKRLVIEEEPAEKPVDDTNIGFLACALFVGLLSGLLVFFTWNRLVTNDPGWPGLGTFAFCVLWGTVLSGVIGFFTSFYMMKRINTYAPCYALLSFMPLILILLLPVLLWLTVALKIVLEIALGCLAVYVIVKLFF